MRTLIFLAAFAASCSPHPAGANKTGNTAVVKTSATTAAPQKTTAAAPRSASVNCAVSQRREILFSDPRRSDTLTLHSEGPDCAAPTVVMNLRDADGTLLWTLTAPYRNLDQRSEDEPATAEEVDDFLRRWVTVHRSRGFPNLPPTVGRPEGFSPGDGLEYSTTLSREEYESVRARNTPVLCFDIQREVWQCLVFGPESRKAIAFVYMTA